MFRKSPVKDLSLLLLGFFLGVLVAHLSLLSLPSSSLPGGLQTGSHRGEVKCPHSVRQVEIIKESPSEASLNDELLQKSNHKEEIVTLPTTEEMLVKAETQAVTVSPQTGSTPQKSIIVEKKRKKPIEIRRPRYLKDELHTRQPLYVGVVTAADFLKSRAQAVNNTWAKYASKVEYFAATESSGVHSSLPVINLPEVDDTYPPQKKVYRMLSYMHDNYINDYNWFMRADDDAYMRIPELISFLSQLDPSEPLYVGSPGFGREGDLERIRLRPHEHYCMGGTGVIFSRELLIQLAPHLDECLQNVVVSWNEDLEVGRCISRRLGIQCTWAYEMRKLFYTDYTKGLMFKDQTIYKDKTVVSALTMHPFKTPDMMHRIHQFFIEIKLKNLDQEKRKYIKELEHIRTITHRTHAFP